jgi:hypothetical protein
MSRNAASSRYQPKSDTYDLAGVTMLARHGGSCSAPGRDLIKARKDEPHLSDGSLAKVWRSGGWLDLKVPLGAEFVPTTTPLPISPRVKIGTNPLVEHLIEASEYTVALGKEGYEDVRLSFHVDYLEDPYHHHGHADMSLKLWQRRTTEKGFVRVCGEVDEEDQCVPFALMKHEVTNEQYLDFVNDAATRRIVDKV